MEAIGDDALLVADGRQVLDEALAEAPVLALAAAGAGDGGRDIRAVLGDAGVARDDVLVAAAPRARLEALPVVHVLVVHRPRRRGEDRGDCQENAERFVARHRSLASLVLGELMGLAAARNTSYGWDAWRLLRALYIHAGGGAAAAAACATRHACTLKA